MSKRKYKAAYQFKTMAGFAFYHGTYFVVKFGKCMKTVHRSFLESWQYRLLEQFVKSGRIYAAERIIDENAEGNS